MTLGQIILTIVVAIFAIIITISVFLVSDSITLKILTSLISVIVVVGLIVFFFWYNGNTASGIRNYKDYQSELDNGLDREVTITAEDGREIFHYEGKIDIESNHEDNYIKFESEEGKRYMIYYGIQDSIIIEEK